MLFDYPSIQNNRTNSDSNNFEIILSKLEKVQQRQSGQWSARCPAHADKGPSLSIRETTEGAVLLHCFAGCQVNEVLSALGLELHDLYPPRERPANAPKRTPHLLNARQALDLLDKEATLCAVAAANIANGVILTVDDLDRVLKAAGYINYLRHECMGERHV